jgi:hypothetical protein
MPDPLFGDPRFHVLVLYPTDTAILFEKQVGDQELNVMPIIVDPANSHTLKIFAYTADGTRLDLVEKQRFSTPREDYYLLYGVPANQHIQLYLQGCDDNDMIVTRLTLEIRTGMSIPRGQLAVRLANEHLEELHRKARRDAEERYARLVHDAEHSAGQALTDEQREAIGRKVHQYEKDRFAELLRAAEAQVAERFKDGPIFNETYPLGMSTTAGTYTGEPAQLVVYGTLYQTANVTGYAVPTPSGSNVSGTKTSKPGYDWALAFNLASSTAYTLNLTATASGEQQPLTFYIHT